MWKNIFNCIKTPPLCILVIYSLCFMACGSQPQSKIENKSDGELKAFLNDYYHTMSDRNWATYQSFFVQDAILTTVWKSETDSLPKISTTSISDFVAQTKDGPDSQPIFEEKMLESEITVKNNLAQAWVRYEAKFGSEGNLLEWTGMDLFSLIKYHEEWKIVSITFESD